MPATPLPTGFRQRQRQPRRASLPRRLLGPVLWLALAMALAVAAVAAGWLWSAHTANRDIATLVSGRDVEVDLGASPPLLFARLNLLLHRDRFEEARIVAERLARHQRGRFAIPALYNTANAHLRHALDVIQDGRFDDATAHVNLAKERYLRVLRLDPGHWDSKYNLDVAMRLVRDFPGHEIVGDDEGEPPERLWTDLPGRPRGMP